MSATNTIKHRFKRIYQSYFPKALSEQEHLLIQSITNPKLVDLYYEQPLSDQRHGILVFEKARNLFKDVSSAPDIEELLIASCFHDVAKKNSFNSTTLRIIAASITDFVPRKTVDEFQHSKFRFLRETWIYANHSELSYDIIEPLFDSDFVKYATLFHHHIDESVKIPDSLRKNIEIFIQADTL